MKRISELLSSMKFTAWILVVLCVWSSWGIVLAGTESFSLGFKLMNSMLVRHWLMQSEYGPFQLRFWFVGLCVLMIILGVNLIFCTWNKIFKIIKIKSNGPRLLMLVVHVIFGLVALGHFGGLMLGFRHDNIRLQEGESFSFEDDHEVRVEEVLFVDDLLVLEKSRLQLTRDDFHYRMNYAGIVLSREGRELSRDRIFMLNPMHSKDIQVTLKRFTPPGSPFDEKADRKPGVLLSISRNPVLSIFLTIYPIMIAGIVIYLVMTWKRFNGKDKERGRNKGRGKIRPRS